MAVLRQSCVTLVAIVWTCCFHLVALLWHACGPIVARCWTSGCPLVVLYTLGRPSLGYHQLEHRLEIVLHFRSNMPSYPAAAVVLQSHRSLLATGLDCCWRNDRQSSRC